MQNLFLLVFSGNAGAVGFVTVLISLSCFFSGLSGITVLSRMGYSMARDGAFPCSHYLSELHPQTKAPTRIIFLIFFLSSLLTLLPLFSTSAFTAIV